MLLSRKKLDLYFRPTLIGFRRCLICLLAVIASLTPAKLLAQTQVEVPDAKPLPGGAFDDCRLNLQCASKDVEGYVLYDAEEFGKALLAWEQAYEILPTPRLWLSQGRCHFRLGNCQKGEELYLRYLKQVPEGEFQPQAEKWLAELRALPQCASTQPAPPPRRRMPPAWLLVLGSSLIAGTTAGLLLGFIKIPHVSFK